MKLINVFKRMWNSKTFELIADITYESSKYLGATIYCLVEVVCETFTQNSESSNKSYISYSSNNEKKDIYQSTYDYWSRLDYDEQESYFNNNEYLCEYIEKDYYPNDRELTARHVAHIADKLNKEFINKYDNY